MWLPYCSSREVIKLGEGRESLYIHTGAGVVHWVELWNWAFCGMVTLGN